MFSRRAIARRWLVQFPRAVPLAIFVLILAGTILTCFAIERVERQSELAQLRERAGAITSALERRANANASYLRAGAALFATLGDVPATRFRRFVSELRLDADYRGAEGIGWAQRVDRNGIDAFNRQVTAEYGEGLRLHPALSPSQPFAAPVTYLEPDTERNHRALGYDMYSEPVRRAAMTEAERTARPTASGKVVLVQEGGGNAPGFLIYMPVFASSDQGVRLKGYVYSAFNAGDFLSSALTLVPSDDLAIALFDEAPNESSLLARHGPATSSNKPVRETVMVADHRWVLEVSRAQGAPLSRLSLAILLAGIAVASLLTLLTFILSRQAQEDGARLSWYEEQNSIRDSLTRELNHRVKNTLANVLSIIALTKRQAGSLEEFSEGLEGRIRALSATHDLLTRSEWGTTPLSSVIQAEISPYSQDCSSQITLEGPDIELAPNDALSLGLAIHELATNAAKYGALKTAEGKLSITWAMIDNQHVKLEWVERDGPPVSANLTRGFGLDLIEKTVAHELDNPVDLRFDPEGVRCTLVVPVRKPHTFNLRRRV